jgi:hypothetical protein
MMDRISSTARAVGKALGVLGLSATLLSASAPRAAAGDHDAKDRLAGVWFVQVTIRDCLTNAPLGAPFTSLGSYFEGGTLSDSTSTTSFAIGQRSDGHGTWKQTDWNIYGQRVVALIVFDTPPNLPGIVGFDPTQPISPGFFAGWQTVTHTIELADANHFTSSGTNAFYKADGTRYRTGCSTSVAERFK